MSNIDENLHDDSVSEEINCNDEEKVEVRIDEDNNDNSIEKADKEISENESLEEKLNEEIKDVEDKKEDIDEKEYIIKYKNQISLDKAEYESSILSYKEWELKLKELINNVNNTFDETKSIVDEFNDKISNLIEECSVEERKAVENRQKGINMINRMSQNVLKNIMNRCLTVEEVTFDELNIEEVLDKSEEELKRITNSNYAIISKICNSRRSLIDKYISFLTINILPILDGIQSGITFIKNSERKIIKEEIVPVYRKLDEVFEELLNKCNIKKLNVNVNDKIDIRLVEIIEVETAPKKELDETVESIIRNGYEYEEDIYGTGNNHILRQAQIIAYKHE